MTIANGTVSVLTSAMPEGIGDLTFASPDWVQAAQVELDKQTTAFADSLQGAARHSFCQVAHNAPQFLHLGNTLSYSVIFENGGATILNEELPDSECDMKMSGDHSILSNMARLVFSGKDPKVTNAARNRLFSLGRFQMYGQQPGDTVLHAIWSRVNDAMAERTMPRFVFMTPEWVSSARKILTSRSTSDKYAEQLQDVDFTFSEEFTDTPKYAFPDGSHGGFWVRCRRGRLTVGAGPLDEENGVADHLTLGMYEPVVPVGRTVNASLTEEEKKAVETYTAQAFRYNKELDRRPVDQKQPSGKGPMPAELARVFLPLHDELSKRTAGDLPQDYQSPGSQAWAQPQSFDRHPDYDPSLLRYDEVDIYGNPLA